MDNEEKQTINYESIIAGLLLRFETIDNVDFSLLIDDFKSKTSIDIVKSWAYHNDLIKDYITIHGNGTITLDHDLDEYIERENCTLREKLVNVSGDIVNNYFKDFDMEEYKQKKAKLLEDNKKDVLENAFVLLISDNEKDYNEMINYGFKNIDNFKSVIRADNFFNDNPDELKKYNIIITGHQAVSSGMFDYNISLFEKIKKLNHKNGIIATNISIYESLNEYIIYLNDYDNGKSYSVNNDSHEKLFDCLVNNTLINHTMKCNKNKGSEFIMHNEYQNPNRLPLPSKKSDLKILYLGSEFDSVDTISEKLGLNITFYEDNNYSLDKHVKRNLGEYDIIIVSDLFSNYLLSMNKESTEQCKDTGRELTLFVTYGDLNWGVVRDIAHGVKIQYSYGGNYALDSDRYSKEFGVIKLPAESFDFIDEKESNTEYRKEKYTKAKAIIESSIRLYNEALNNKDLSLEDIDLKSAEEYDTEYHELFEYLEKKRLSEIAPVRAFYNMKYTVNKYLEYRNAGIPHDNPEGLRITEYNDKIKVENIYQGRVLCSIIFNKKYTNPSIYDFEVQTVSKKGNLTSPQRVGVYTSEFENKEGVPNRPDEKQLNAINSIEKKVERILEPLNKELYEINKEMSDVKKLLLRRKNKVNVKRSN